MGGFFDWWGGGSSNSSTQTQLNKLQKEIDAIKTNISLKVDKVIGKGLSTNDFTDEYKNKVDNFTGGTVNVVENNVEVDTSLTKDGCAADAKVTGERFENIIKDLGKVESSAVQSVKEYIKGLNLNTSTGETATATVNNTDYVTPQMFGAKANGWTDDTDAIQQAINSGKSVYLSSGTYIISQPLVIDNKHFWNFHGGDATIRYTGDEYAIRMLMVENCNIEIGRIISPNGGGVEFYSDSADSWSQYVVFAFSWIECKTDCIHIEVSNGGWSNENQIYGGRFTAGENGVYLHHADENYTNGWKFYNCGIEGVTNGFLFDAGQGYINSMVIVAPRYEESYKTILKTIGFVFDCMWLGTSVIKQNELVCSANTSRFEIFAPIRTIWDGTLIRHRGCIIDGKLMAEKIQYEEAK